jgi:hypothetical protein
MRTETIEIIAIIVYYILILMFIVGTFYMYYHLGFELTIISLLLFIIMRIK